MGGGEPSSGGGAGLETSTLPGAFADTGAAGATRSSVGLASAALPAPTLTGVTGFTAGFASPTLGSVFDTSFVTAFGTGLTGVLRAVLTATFFVTDTGALTGVLGAAFATPAFTGVFAAGALGTTGFDLLGEADFIESLTDLAAGFAVDETGFATEGLATDLFGLPTTTLLGLPTGFAEDLLKAAFTTGLLALGDLAEDLATGLATFAAGFFATGLTAAFGLGFAAARDVFLPTC